MRKTALSDEILLSVEHPERYIGGEINSVQKNKEDIAVRFAMCFPDVYEIGMSHLGIQILYEMFNKRTDVWCERVYSPWLDLDRIMREKHIPLFALESQDPVRCFDFLGITLQYEMCYTNVLQILDLSDIPLKASERDPDAPLGECPIVIGGGPCAYNPEPVAPFFDMFYIGEGERRYDELLELYISVKKQGGTRLDFLEGAAHIEGIYIPSFYKPVYNDDGTYAGREKLDRYAPDRVVKAVCTGLDDAPYPLKPVVPFIKVTQDRVVLEIQRGCIRGCRFCQAGMIYRPVREKSLDTLKGYAKAMVEATGDDEISLSSLSSSDYSKIAELVKWLVETYKDKFINISLPSLRIDHVFLEMMETVQDSKKGSLTFAPEAGSQRMRDVINKGITEEDIMQGSAICFTAGYSKVKLYFMLGLPGETDEDVTAIAHLANGVAMNYFDTVPKEERKGIRVQVTSSTSFFVPKPFTPFQWSAMDTPDEFLRKAHLVNETMENEPNHKSLKYQYHESDLSKLEGVFARGDRRVAEVILTAYGKGCMYDSWTESFDSVKWDEAFRECGLDAGFYTLRERPLDESFPWDFIDIGVTKDFLEKEYLRSKEALITPNCRDKCSGCGAARFGTGICTVPGKVSEGYEA
ncbi:MAG: TIGR03960 family B12-binding radical SAM protein [Lachnospiraceae bacterium]|nr:TIGR03960 family B12-binding radical SAM protein [Lachnospiraceae bacterium]